MSETLDFLIPLFVGPGSLAKGLAWRRAERPPGWRARPERVVLEPRAGAKASTAPPVRIFVGTEPGQFRSERVLLWSIEQKRDPSRTYEVYLMRDLVGFDRRRWLTGFTNYRFAIPDLAGRSGRAIYNDVDQIYLADPAELFDLDMGQKGFLSINRHDTSVMLIDCARMASLWNAERARAGRRKQLEAEATAEWGPLAGVWNARDEEFVKGESKVLHFTTIHTQPWQPFPEQFVYQKNPVGHVWEALERAADAADFLVFSARRPSEEFELFRARRAGAATASASPHASKERVLELLREAGGSSVAHVGLAPQTPAIGGGATVEHLDLAALTDAPARRWDAVWCGDGLGAIPEGDVPWVVRELFARAEHVLRVDILEEATGESSALPCVRNAAWWSMHFNAASARRPQVYWELSLQRSDGGEPVRLRGGRRPDGAAPRVWVLTDHKAGHTTQSVGLAEALGWPYEVKPLVFKKRAARAPGRGVLAALDRERSAPLDPPWPDLVISTGRRNAPVTRWIGAASGGRARTVQLGRKGGDDADAFDLVVSCAYFKKPLHPRRVEITAPLCAVNDERLATEAEKWRDRLFTGAPPPHVALIVGGSSALHALDAESARKMAEEVADFAAAAGGSLFAITSPRTSADAVAALRAALASRGHLHEWRRGQSENPYPAYLALADVLVVTGDSESMLSEAAATRKPLYIYPVPEKTPGLRRRWSDWVTAHAYARPRKQAKGTVRPQQGFEYLCARLLQRGAVRPTRDMNALHRGLIERGAALPFGAPMTTAERAPLREAAEVAARVRTLLGYPPEADTRAG